MSNEIYANTKQLEKIAELLEGYPKDAARVMNRVLSRTADSARVAVVKQIPTAYGITQKEIKSALNNKRRKVKTIMGASGEGSVSVEVLGRPLTITRFRYTPKSPPKKTKRGKRRKYRAKAMVFKSRGKLTVGPLRGKDGKNKSVFLMPVKNASTDYLFAYRTGLGDKKEKVKVIRTLSIPQMVTNEQVAPLIVDNVNKVMEKRLTHELDLSFGNLGTNLFHGGK